MPLVSASNETQAKYCALMFLGVPLKIAGLQKYKVSISVGVRSTEVLATTQTSDLKPGHGTKAVKWGMT